MPQLQDFEATTISGDVRPLDEYEGKVVLVVNTATECGFTPQFDGLEKLWQEYGDQGPVVLGFPCNQFGGQEPLDGEELEQACRVNHGVTFPLFEKIEVNGDEAHPLYKWLRTEARGALGSEKIKWNFTKFLVGKDGKVVKRFGSNTKPEKLVGDIEKQLAA